MSPSDYGQLRGQARDSAGHQSGGKSHGADRSRTSSSRRSSSSSAGDSGPLDLCVRSSAIRSGNPANASANSSRDRAVCDAPMGMYVGRASASESTP